MAAPVRVNKSRSPAEAIPVVQEQLKVGKRTRHTGHVTVQVVPETRPQHIDLPLKQEQVDVERVPVNQEVDKPFPTRHEGDTTIIPVFEEVLIVQKRLMLKEEVRITRRRTIRKVHRKVPLRSERVRVKRTKV